MKTAAAAVAAVARHERRFVRFSDIELNLMKFRFP